MSRSALHVTVSRLGSLLVFFILLIIANIIYIDSSIYQGIVNFFNSKILVIIVFSLLLYLGELFFVFRFPLNFPAPIFNAFGGVMLVGFIFDIIVKVMDLTDVNLGLLFRTIEIPVVILVFLLAIIVGYVRVFGSIGRKSRERKRKEIKNKKQESDWELFKENIKEAIHDVGENIKKAVHPEDSDSKSTSKKTSKKKVTRKKSSSKNKK